jgi:HEAT repeat protein
MTRLPGNDLDRKDWLERRSAIVRAGRSGEIDGLLAGLADPDHRAKAAHYLGRAGDPRAIPPLHRLLLSAGDAHVRAAAATALGKLGARDALPDLLTIASSDPEGFVRAWAIDAVRAIGDRATVESIIPLLDDPDRRVRSIAIIALADLGGESAASGLRTAASQRPVHQRPRYWRAARRATRAATEEAA